MIFSYECTAIPHLQLYWAKIVSTFSLVPNCNKFVHTSDCNSNTDAIGKEDCNTKIQNGWPGYCDCFLGIKVMEKGCESGEYDTCYSACDSLASK